MIWKDKLTKDEFKHIRETTQNGLLREFKENRKIHWEWNAEKGKESCIICRMIALKLGIE